MEELISPLSKDSLDLELIKTKLKDYLLQEDVITDVDYEGSNISILVSIISYVMLNINSTHALNVNQTTLKLSTIRQNIIQLAKSLNYNITRRKSSKMNVTLTYSGISSYSLPKWTEFTCGDYKFYNSELLQFTSGDSITVDLIQGTFLDYNTDENLKQTISQSTLEEITLNYKNIENDNIYLKVQKSGETTYNQYTRTLSKLSLNNNEKFYFEEYEPETQFITLVTSFFGQGNLLEFGDTFDISFLISDGVDANGIVECVSPIDTINITVNSASRAGANEESDNSIKENAPLFYNTNDNTVSDDDYNAVLVKNSLVEIANSWGGETILPEKLGWIFLCLIPQDANFKYLSSLEEIEILNYLNKKPMVATARKFKHPNYFNIDFSIKILGDVQDISQRKIDINTKLTEYFITYQNRFEIYFYENKTNELIENLFVNEVNASTKIEINPKLLLSKELFEQTFDNNRLDIWIPNSPKKKYLVKGSDRILFPDNERDLYSYFINGWSQETQIEEDLDITFSGTINSKTITYDSNIGTVNIGGIIYNKRDILLDSTIIGYFILDLDILSLTDLTSELNLDSYINVNYENGINAKLMKSSIIKLGDITYL